MKNPFAVKNGSIVCIADLDSRHTGAKCRCNCIVCEMPMIAKMGNVREHHFAHMIGQCDDRKTFVLSLYALVKQILDTKKIIALPGIKLEYNENLFTGIEQRRADFPENPGLKYKDAVHTRKLEVDSTEILIKNNKSDPIIVFTCKNQRYAIRLKLPYSVSKEYLRLPFENLSTLEINFDFDEIRLSSLTEKEIEIIVSESISRKKWIKNMNCETKIQELKDEMKNRYGEQLYFVNEQKKEEEDDKSSPSQNIFKTNINLRQKHMSETEKYQAGYLEISAEFQKFSTTKYIDSIGYRWIYCKECRDIKRIDQFSEFGISVTPNISVCKKHNMECEKNFIQP